MCLRSRLAVLILATTVGACSSDSDDADDSGGTDSDAGDADASAPAPDAMPDDAAPPADAAGPPDTGPPVDAAVPDCGRIKCDCTFEGIALYGRVQYVGELDFPDVRVLVSMFPDLRVQELDLPVADSCGEWEIVKIDPDFTVELVDSVEDFPDFEIQYSFPPGIPR
jgi:hypothetical protein